MKLKNDIFAKVLDWLIKENKVADQKDLARKTGISQNTISRIMTGKVEPSDETLRRLNDAFGNIFNMQYLRGKEAVALIEDVAYYKLHPEKQPFSEKTEQEEKEKESSMQGHPDYSSLINATIAAKDDAIDSYKKLLESKDDYIASLEQRIKEKDDYIATLKERLVEYRRTIDSQNLTSYPFPIGAADNPRKPRQTP